MGVTTPTMRRLKIAIAGDGGGNGAAAPPGRGARQHLAFEGHAALESQGKSLRAIREQLWIGTREMLCKLEGDDFGDP